jgi:hypothetical protein
MTSSSPDIVLDVDLRNPGQFFACCGTLELASRLWRGSEGWFVKEGPGIVFQVATYSGHNDPLGEIIRQLCDSAVLVRLADDHAAQSQADRKPVVIVPFCLRLDWWVDSYRGGDKSELKVWAGQQTPERNLKALREAWREIRAQEPDERRVRSLFQKRWPMTGRFGFDPSASWEALDIGFSPDEQGIGALTSPATEILAAIGLQRHRPLPAEGGGRRFVYYVWKNPVEVTVAPAAMGGVSCALAAYEFPILMRNAQYGSFGWAKHWEK